MDPILQGHQVRYVWSKMSSNKSYIAIIDGNINTDDAKSNFLDTLGEFAAITWHELKYGLVDLDVVDSRAVEAQTTITIWESVGKNSGYRAPGQTGGH